MIDPKDPSPFDATALAGHGDTISPTDATMSGQGPRPSPPAGHGDAISPTDATMMSDQGPRPSPPSPAAGAARIGRYVVLETLGAGGMGVVLAAYDPSLDRKVAIKMIHALRGDDPERRLRMEREAQAMARLSHPNVVTVYEVGEYEGQLYLAMEFVKGRDLRAWLAALGDAPRWREIVAMFLQAGEGLAAAHRAGLVHRDFKPDNVFVRDDGRALVGDFGLARRDLAEDAEDAATRAKAERRASASISSSLSRPLTMTGAAMGTPAYMAPEQFAGASTDARTDQFSFCAALWEALYGRRPFAGETLPVLMTNVTSGRRALPDASRSVPTWVRRVLDRGLSIAPADRYPTTEAMLAALRADPTRRRRALFTGAAAALVIGGWFGADHLREARAVAACEAAGVGVDAVWNDAAAARLREGLLATRVAYAETTADRVRSLIDAQAGALRGAHREACLDARVRGRWDEETLARAESCLDERRWDLEALLEAFTGADAESVRNAVEAAVNLSPVGPCTDTHHLAAQPTLPADRAGVDAIRRTISRVDALRAAGDFNGALPIARGALTAAEALGWPPLIAVARFDVGKSLEGAGDYAEAEAALEAAYFQAAEVGAFEVAADAAVSLTYVVGVHEARHADGFRWSRHADVALAALGVDLVSSRRGGALNNLGNVRFAAGEYEEAKEILERALAIDEEIYGADHLKVASVLSNLATVHTSMGSLAQAKALFARALAIYERELGDDHPEVAITVNNLANVYKSAGDYEEARALYARVFQIFERELGPDHPTVAVALNNLASADDALGEYAAAKALHLRALDIRERALGLTHPEVAQSLNNLAHVLVSLGDLAEAKALHQRALAIREAALGPDHPQVAISLNNLGRTLTAMGEHAAARPLHQRALAIWEKALGPDHALVASALVGLARVALAEGQGAEALALAERAVRIFTAGATPAEKLAEARIVLARALRNAPAGEGQDRARAREVAEAARDALRGVKGAEQELAEVEALLEALASAP